MRAAIYYLFIFCIVGVSFAGRNDTEVKKWFIQQALECTKENPVTGEELQMLKDHKIPDHKNTKCLVACLFKKIDWIDEKGMFNEENAYKFSEREYPGETDKLENAKKLHALCAKINDEKITGENEACERAALLAGCFTEHATSMGFLIE